MNKPTQKDNISSSDSDVMILKDKDQPAYPVRTSRNKAIVVPTELEEQGKMGLTKGPATDYSDALMRDGGVSADFSCSSIEDLTFSCGHAIYIADADSDYAFVFLIAQQNSAKV